jgi:hypothetical protein
LSAPDAKVRDIERGLSLELVDERGFAMPGSPVTKTICRSPFTARWRASRNAARGRSRPTSLPVAGATDGAGAAPSLTGAMKRYPRRGRVSMNSGFLESSPRADRTSKMWLFRTSAWT